jgi:glycosyltransferase involved in cell wall biosynthesis
VSVVLPCLNEVDSVGLCVAEARNALREAGIEHEVVVVDNGSVDGSAEAARAAGARVVDEERPGYGSALLAGFAAAREDVVVMADADFTYDFRRLPDLVRPVLHDEADLVVGGRLDQATRRTMPLLHRYVGTPVLTYFVARACGRRLVSDSQSGFRAFRRDLLDRLRLQSTGMELASEMLIRAAQAGLRVQEVPTGYRERIGASKLSTFSDGLRHLQLIVLLAPDIVLLGPGLVLLALGLVFTALGLAVPRGIEVGSLRWQPVFFAGIALVIGVQAVLAAAILAHRSSVAAGAVKLRFAFVSSPRFHTWCMAGGSVAVAAGLLIDALLFLRWLGGDTARDIGVTSVAQSLIIVGSTLAIFGLMARVARIVGDRTELGS